MDILALKAAAAKSNPTVAWPEVLEEDRQISMCDGQKIRIRIFRPRDQQKSSPLLVWYHGGGYCVGSIEGEAEYCKIFCKDLRGVAVSVDYRLAPEWKFPTAPNDCFDALKWVSQIRS